MTSPCNLDEFYRLVRGTRLSGASVEERWTHSREPPALALKLGSVPAEAAWRSLRDLTHLTGRYPLILDSVDVELSFSLDRPANDYTQNDDYYERVFVAAAELPPFVPQSNDERWLFDFLDGPLERYGNPIGETLRHFGRCPSSEDVKQRISIGEIRTNEDLEKWLLIWELHEFGELATLPTGKEHVWNALPEEDQEYIILLPPAETMWKASAFAPFWPNDSPSAIAASIEILRSWSARYGAELTYALGTSRYIHVASRPKSIHEAFDLAREHRYVGRQDCSLREQARHLMATNEWLFHNRP